jgi:TPR repeat protein
MVRTAVVLGAVLLGWQPAAFAQQAAADGAAASPSEPASVAALARAGDARAQFLMGMRARAGTTATVGQRGAIRPDPAKAFEWFRLSAQQGNTDAEFQVARAYAEGDGVARDLVKAQSWYARAADGGHALAQFNLALMRERGEGAPRDAAAARKLYEQAAARGLVGAMRQLAALYAGGDRNLVQALAWVDVAVARTGAQAPTAEGDEVFRRFLIEQMTPEQIARAEGLAKERLASLPADPTAPVTTAAPAPSAEIQPH